MQKVHFIGIGGDIMHNLAIAVSHKNNYFVTGSDLEFDELKQKKLIESGIMPEKFGWFTERIHKYLQAVVVASEINPDNIELLKSKELGLKIYSIPEFIFQQTRSKTRIVIMGMDDKATITAMILHVLNKLNIDVDYQICNKRYKISPCIKLTYDSRIAVFEGNFDKLSKNDNSLRDYLYKPHIALISFVPDNLLQTVDKDTIKTFFNDFISNMEVQGRLIYFDEDDLIQENNLKLRRDIVSFRYNMPDVEIHDNKTFVKMRKGKIAVGFDDRQNLLNLNAARLVCRQIGVTDEQFYNKIVDFQIKS